MIGPRWWVLQHDEYEHPAAIADALAARGVHPQVVRLDLDEPLPTPEDVEGLVVMGGDMGALDDADFPHLVGERALLAACVEREVPVLGVCLGAQLLAAALGADVYRGPQGEVGGGTVELTPEGAADPLFAGVDGPLAVVHWHHDTFDLPAGAVLLASSERYAHQAFRVGELAYGLQFHVELGLRELPMLREQMNLSRIPSEQELGAIQAVGAQVLERFARITTAPSD